MIEKIISSIKLEKFLDEYFEKIPLLQKRKGANAFEKFFSLVDFDQYLISGEGFLQELVRVTRQGRSIPIPTYSGQATTQREFVLDQFKLGATIKLEELDSRHAGMAELCKSLSEIFGGYVFAKPFLTGASFSGLDVHFDTTEVFVIQMEGKKNWRVWSKIIENPTLPMQKDLTETNLGSTVIETTLESGDVLYIPAGTPHAAKCLDEYSLHLSVGLQPIKLFEVLEGYIRLISEHVSSLRKNIYPFSKKITLEENLNHFLTNKLTNITFQEMYSDFGIAYNATKYETCNKKLTSLANVASINESTALKVRKDACIRIRKTQEEIAIYFSSTISPKKPLVSAPSHLLVPKYCQLEIEAIINHQENCFTPSELCGSLETDSKVLLCKELVKAGILIVI